MRILSITAQKPNSTGSGVFLTELVRALGETGQEQMAVGGIYKRQYEGGKNRTRRCEPPYLGADCPDCPRGLII